MFDFLKPFRLRRLDPAEGYKPLDFGGWGGSGSLDAFGRIIAYNVYHSQHGYVTLTTAAPFDEDRRYDPQAVRAYRRSLVDLQGFGPYFAEELIEREVYLVEDVVPFIRMRFANDGVAEVVTLGNFHAAHQFWHFKDVSPRWRGDICLQRCAYTQLTEGGVVEIPSALSQVSLVDNCLVLENADLNQVVAISGLPFDRLKLPDKADILNVEVENAASEVYIRIVFEQEITKATGFAANYQEAQILTDSLPALLNVKANQWLGLPDDLLLRRGLAYAEQLAVGRNEAAVVLTDHMLLPLSWNRDAYFTALAILASENLKSREYYVRRHLIWMFEAAERINGFWGRAYLANGKVKDRAYQLDQQLYPLLELAEYVQTTEDPLKILPRLQPHIELLIDELMATKSPDAWLFPTEESAGDDHIPYPYPLSSHMLMCHTFNKLAELDVKSQYDFRELAAHVRDSIQTHFITEYEGRRIYAYATDGAGHFHFYHDANDFPLALAPVWGLVNADDPVWRATIDYAFSEANTGGFYDGSLGSIHTPAPWALGDIQEIIVARAIGDKEREARVRARLQNAAQWDGALPEAYDATTGEVVSRHWFAWPNAAYACIELGVFDK